MKLNHALLGKNKFKNGLAKPCGFINPSDKELVCFFTPKCNGCWLSAMFYH